MQRINEDILNTKIRLVGEDFAEADIVSLDYALDKAFDNGLDLVEMAERDGISICKIMDYQKFLYEQKKAKKQSVKKIDVKEIKFGCMIADHDLEVASKKASKILNEGDRVKVLVIFKGRQMAFANTEGPKVMNKFLSLFDKESYTVVKPQKLEGYTYTTVIEKKK